ncbi:MAG: AAA family ATPase [Thermoguttaceae bacterium]|jgi:AAA+ superfamily predicted ATPase
MAKMQLISADGMILCMLPGTAEELLLDAEAFARRHRLAKQSYFPIAVRDAIERAGFQVTDVELNASLQRLDVVRRGHQVDVVRIRVTPSRIKSPSVNGGHREKGMPTKTILNARFFESERTFPNAHARAWYDRLVGLDSQKRELLLELELLLYPDRLAAWSRAQYGSELHVCEVMASRARLLLLEGDVGCGKTILAETVGDALAQRTNTRVHLLKVNTQVRGTGMVGEMTELIVQAFTHAESHADALRGEPVLLLIDEADALAARRTDQHMHHEDKAGLNTLLQRIDGLRLSQRRIAVIFITNRPDALDPAVRRRAAIRLTFGRPSDDVRAELFRRSLPELNLSPGTVAELVSLTGKGAKQKSSTTFTASDITDRLLPAALREAYAENRRLTAEDLVRHARTMLPTPLMTDGDHHGE